MPTSPEEELLRDVNRCATHFNRGNVTANEVINKLFDCFANMDRVYPDVIPAIWAALPGPMLNDFEIALRNATKPEFRYRAFFIGGLPRTEEELRRDAELRTARVRAWAIEFIRYLDSRSPG